MYIILSITISSTYLLKVRSVRGVTRKQNFCARTNIQSVCEFQVAYFVARGVSPDLVDRGGMTPLMWAVWKICSLDPTRLLLTLGASTNLADQQGNTALHWAILARNTIAISTLIVQVSKKLLSVIQYSLNI